MAFIVFGNQSSFDGSTLEFFFLGGGDRSVLFFRNKWLSFLLFFLWVLKI